LFLSAEKARSVGKTMKHSSSLERFRVEGLALPEETLRPLIATRTEWLKDIFKVFLHQIAVAADFGQFPPSPRYVLHRLHKDHKGAQPEPHMQSSGVSSFGQKAGRMLV
jgi:hypothetical protein